MPRRTILPAARLNQRVQLVAMRTMLEMRRKTLIASIAQLASTRKQRITRLHHAKPGRLVLGQPTSVSWLLPPMIVCVQSALVTPTAVWTRIALKSALLASCVGLVSMPPVKVATVLIAPVLLVVLARSTWTSTNTPRLHVRQRAAVNQGRRKCRLEA